MKSPTLAIVVVVALSPAAEAYSFGGQQLRTSARNNAAGSLRMEYIPSGLSKEQWAKMKEKERNKNKGKNLGKVGITSFKSRSFADWQKAGGVNLFPVDPKSVKSQDEIPYMQRAGGSADGDDLKPKKGLFNFSFGKKEPEPEPEPPKKKSPWTF